MTIYDIVRRKIVEYIGHQKTDVDIEKIIFLLEYKNFIENGERLINGEWFIDNNGNIAIEKMSLTKINFDDKEHEEYIIGKCQKMIEDNFGILGCNTKCLDLILELNHGYRYYRMNKHVRYIPFIAQYEDAGYFSRIMNIIDMIKERDNCSEIEAINTLANSDVESVFDYEVYEEV